MKSIWYFVGLILSVMGCIILVTGIVQIIIPPQTATVLAQTHPNIWWGAIMTVFGGVMYFGSKKKKI